MRQVNSFCYKEGAICRIYTAGGTQPVDNGGVQLRADIEWQKVHIL